MILSKRVSLNNVQLDELDERIVIASIDEAAGKDSISAAGMVGSDGQRITNIRRDTLDVTVKFRLLIHKEDMQARSRLLETIIGWAANGGWLRIGYRPGRRLLVTMAQAPGEGDLWNWTTDFTLTFRAYSVPFWEDDSETRVTGQTGAAGRNLPLPVPGNTKTYVSFTVQNMSGMDINTITIYDRDKTSRLAFTGLALKANNTLTVDYLVTQKLFAVRNRIGSKSVMPARTADSSDDFAVNPGTVYICWDAQRAVKLTAIVRGRYL